METNIKREIEWLPWSEQPKVGGQYLVRRLFFDGDDSFFEVLSFYGDDRWADDEESFSSKELAGLGATHYAHIPFTD